jgi:isopenicillin N synthase-like dioxygenase
MSDIVSSIPVLDLHDYRAGGDAEADGAAGAAFVARLREVVHTIGFFQLVGHGVDAATLAEASAVASRFFALPEEARHEIDNVKSPQFRGYTRFGHERTNGQLDLRDQIDIGREQPARAPGDAELGPGGNAWLRLRGPNLWPSALPQLRPVLTDLMAQLERVAAVLLGAMCEALGLAVDHFAEAVSPPEVLLKVIRYRTPADTGGGDPPSRQGVGSHRDTGFLTFVHQHAVGGLQVERDGQFVDVPVMPDAFVVNIGEMFQLVTRGYFKATVHRVVSPPPGVERVSLAYFFNPKLEATLAPIDLPPELAAEAPGGDSIDPSNPILANYGDNSLKVRLRAHPDVAEAHHADLLASGRWTM